MHTPQAPEFCVLHPAGRHPAPAFRSLALVLRKVPCSHWYTEQLCIKSASAAWSSGDKSLKQTQRGCSGEWSLAELERRNTPEGVAGIPPCVWVCSCAHVHALIHMYTHYPLWHTCTPTHNCFMCLHTLNICTLQYTMLCIHTHMYRHPHLRVHMQCLHTCGACSHTPYHTHSSHPHVEMHVYSHRAVSSTPVHTEVALTDAG